MSTTPEASNTVEQPTPHIAATTEQSAAPPNINQSIPSNTTEHSMLPITAGPSMPPAKRPHKAPEAPPIPKAASAPFNSERADVIIRTSDSVDFRVRKGVLAAASPFFDDMFTLPSIPVDRKRKNRDDGDEYIGDIPVIPMAEDSGTVDVLLRFCYPCRDPKIAYSIYLCRVLEASRKYIMEEVEERVYEQVQTMMRRKPFELYAIAAVRGWRKEMAEAAKFSLFFTSIDDAYVPALEPLNYGHVQRLKRYHRACSHAAAGSIKQNGNTLMLPWLQDSTTISFGCTHPKHQPSSSNTSFPQSPKRHQWFKIAGDTTKLSAPDWLFDGLIRMRDAIKARPRGTSAMETELLSEIIRAGMAPCSECASRVSLFVNQLAKEIAKEVEVEISRVQLQFDGPPPPGVMFHQPTDA